MQEPAKIRINQSTVCQLLDISRDTLSKLPTKDHTFPRPMKDGDTRQAPVYFDYQEIKDWHEKKKASRTACTVVANDGGL